MSIYVNTKLHLFHLLFYLVTLSYCSFSSKNYSILIDATWYLLQHGVRVGEGRERIRLGHTFILHPLTFNGNLRYMLA